MASLDSKGNRPQTTGFIGRNREMGVLTAALDDAIAGRGRLVMLAGEPGIGKTRMAQELATLADAKGAKVLWGWCYEREGAPPYWPWLQAIRSCVGETDPEQLRREMGPGGADISEILPELLTKLEDLETPPALEPEQARFRLFLSIATFLKNASLNQPLVLVLEDLHWADEPSLLLLEFLGREIGTVPILTVGTYRDVEVTGHHPLTETLGTLVREDHFLRIQLDGLSLQEVGELIVSRTGIEVQQDAVVALHQRTEGNPLFVGEVVGEVSPEQLAGDLAWVDRIPGAVRDAIARRLSRLSGECSNLLDTASVIGRDFDFALLRTLSPDVAEDAFLKTLEEALRTRVIEALPESPGRYRFSHALIQQAVYEEIPATGRMQAHAAIGEALERMHRANIDEHAAELAHHFTEASPVAGTSKLLKYTALAGERALEAYSHEEALGYFQRGLIAKGVDIEGAMPAPDAEAAALFFGLGRAQAAALGRQKLDVAVASLNRAFDYYAEANDVTHAVGVAEYPIAPLPGHRVSSELVARALRLLPTDSQEAGRLLSRYVLVMGLEEGDYQSASEAFESALAIAQRTGDAALEMRTLAHSSTVDFWHLRWRDTVANGLKVIEMARSAADQLLEVSARFWVGVALQHMGESKKAQPHALAMLSIAENLRDRYWLATALWLNELASSYLGDWQAARDFNQRGQSVSPSDMRFIGTRMLLEHQVGDVVQGDWHLERLVEALRSVTPGPKYDYAAAALTIPIAARITGAVDRLYIAESAAATVLSAGSATPLVSRFARLGLGLTAVLRGDVAGAREQYDSLGLAAGTCSLISGDRVLGLLAWTMGDLEQAIAHSEDALAFCRNSGYRHELAWADCDYADMLLERDNEGDREKAESLLDDALSIATELGMTPLVEKAAALREEMGSTPARSPAYPDGLTQREIEVLRLVCGGKTNREIGEVLVISAKTAGKHVSNILNKTNTANRAEAATYAALHNIV